MACTERVVILVDMDCFYCQVEEKLDSKLEGKPIAVVQYNAWRGGGIIAVNYLAREKGVTRHMRGEEAKEKCPDIELVKVPEVRGKADLTKYREAGKRVAEVLQTFTPILERASVDEAYLDITELVKKRITTNFSYDLCDNLPNTYVVGYDIKDFVYNIVRNVDYCESNCRLAVGGVISEEIRADVFKKTGYKCSAGIAHNKILAKLVCGLHKPNKQTILPHESVPELYKDLAVKKVQGLGGKFGAALSHKLKISKMGELITFSKNELINLFDEKTGNWLYNIARGIDYEPVRPKLLSKSIGCCKKFPGITALVTLDRVEHWVNEFTSEICERLEKDLEENNRRAEQITVHFTQTINGKDITNSRTLPLISYNQSKMSQICLKAINKSCAKPDGTYDIKYLGFTVGNFKINKKTGSISHFFENMRNCKLEEDISRSNNILKTNRCSSVLPRSTDLTTEQQNELLCKNDCLNSFNEEEYVVAMEKKTSADSAIFNQSYCEDNASIYSADTDDLNEDPKSLIYFEDIYPEGVAIEPIFLKHSSRCNNEHMSEISSMSSKSKNDFVFNKRLSGSFFSKYFEESSTYDSCHSSVLERNFDTSKSLVAQLESTDENMVHNKSFAESQRKEQLIDINMEYKQELSDSRTCPECQKNIQNSEFQSHRDYHYALNISGKETKLYKPEQSSSTKKNSLEGQSAKHLKKLDSKKKIKNLKSIQVYLQRDKLNDENSEVCPECNKRIKLNAIMSHLDYHTAKKLHAEINIQMPSASNRNSVEKVSIKEKNKKVGSKGNILTFLNQ